MWQVLRAIKTQDSFQKGRHHDAGGDGNWSPPKQEGIFLEGREDRFLPQSSDRPRNEATCPAEGPVPGHTLLEEACAVSNPAPGELSSEHHERCRLQASGLHEAEPGSLSVCPSVDEGCAAPGIYLVGLSALGTEHMGHPVSSSIHSLGSQTQVGGKPRLPLTYPRQVFMFTELQFMHLQNGGCGW